MFIILSPKSKFWVISSLLYGIPNSSSDSIVHDKDPIDLDEAIDILLHYGHITSKDHNKSMATTPMYNNSVANEIHPMNS